MTTTSKLGITLVEQSQAQKEVTVNQALTRIDAFLNTGAVSRTTDAPPGSPAAGDLYIVGSSPTGAWSGQAGKIAFYDQAWKFITPREGVAFWVNDEDVAYVYQGTGWALHGSGGGGFANVFRNPGFNIWQRGASGTIVAGTPAYTADGWVVSSSGANVTWAREGGNILSPYSLKVTGNTSVSNTFIRQRVESFLVYPFVGESITFQAQIWNSTGGNVTPTLTVRHAGAPDNWSSPTVIVNAQSLQTCPDSAWTRISYSFTAPAGAVNGIEATVDFGGVLNTNGKSVQITECDLRASPSIQTPELRPISIEAPMNQRYYQQMGGGSAFENVVNLTWFSTTNAVGAYHFPVEMRAIPTIAFAGTFQLLGGAGALGSVGTDQKTTRSCQFNITSGTSGVTGQSTLLRANNDTSMRVTFSAEL